MTASKSDWNDVEELLDTLLDAPENLHAKILSDLRSTDGQLAKRVEKLIGFIRTDTTLPNRVDVAAPELFAAMAKADALAHVGEEIGPYRIVSFMQQGGMGAVFRGERSDGAFEQSVAIKLIPASISTPAARAMFERERHHLARLEHPNIARIIDAGVTASERPFYVMEFIDGIPIDQFVTERLSRKEILTLFLQLCDAVAYCHRSMIIHGDIKPSNVLVSEGRVRLLDFGIGQLIEEAGGSEEPNNIHAYSAGYAPPEQQRGDAITVTSDVFALGALLKRLLALGIPSQASADVSAIVAKCMQPDSANRYSSVEALQNDIRAHLTHLPVQARAATAVYRAEKFVRRNTIFVTATAGIIMSLIVGLAAALWQFDAARDEAQRSKQVSLFLTSLFERATPSVAGEIEITLLDVVNDAASRLNTELTDLPRVRSELKQLLGSAFYGIGEFERSFELHQEALNFWLENESAPHVEIVRALNALGVDHRERGEYQIAVTLHREAIAQLSALDQEHSIEAWDSWSKLGYSLKEIDAIEGTKAFHRAHAINLKIRPNDTIAIARSLGQIATGYRAENKIERSIEFNERALDIAQDNGEFLAPAVISMRCALALDYGTSGFFEKAYAAQTLCVEQASERLGPRHPWNVWYLSNLGALDLRLGRLGMAEQSFVEAIAIADEKLPPKSIGRLAAEINHAVVLWHSGHADQAARNLTDILGRMEESYGAKHASSGRVRSLLGRVKLELGLAKSAARFIENSLGVLSGDWRSDALLWLAEAKLALSESSVAAELARESLEMRQSNLRFAKWQKAEAEYVLAAATGDSAGLAAAIETFDQTLPANHFRRFSAP